MNKILFTLCWSSSDKSLYTLLFMSIDHTMIWPAFIWEVSNSRPKVLANQSTFSTFVLSSLWMFAYLWHFLLSSFSFNFLYKFPFFPTYLLLISLHARVKRPSILLQSSFTLTAFLSWSKNLDMADSTQRTSYLVPPPQTLIRNVNRDTLPMNIFLAMVGIDSNIVLEFFNCKRFKISDIFVTSMFYF